jgi:hypothetical protein
MVLFAKCHTLCRNHLRRKFFILSLVLISKNRKQKDLGRNGKFNNKVLAYKRRSKQTDLCVCVCARHNHPTQLRGDSDTFFLIFFGSLAHKERAVFFIRA